MQDDTDTFATSGHRKSMSFSSQRKDSQKHEQIRNNRNFLAQKNHLHHLSLTPEVFDQMCQREARIQRHGDSDRFALLEGLQQVLKEQLRKLLRFEEFWSFLGKYFDSGKDVHDISVMKGKLEATVRTVWLALIESLQLKYWQEDGQHTKDNASLLKVLDHQPEQPILKDGRKTSRMFNRSAGRPFNRDFNVAVTLLVLHVSMQLEGFPVLAVDWPRLVMCKVVPFMDAWRLVSADLWSLRLHQYQRCLFRPRKVPVTLHEHIPAFLGRLGSVSLIPERYFDLKPVLNRLFQALYLDGTIFEGFIIDILHNRASKLGIVVYKSKSDYALTGRYLMVRGLGLVAPIAVLAAAAVFAIKLVMFDQNGKFENAGKSTKILEQYLLSLEQWKSIPMLETSQTITDLYAFDRLVQVALSFAPNDNPDFRQDIESLKLPASWKDLPSSWNESKLFHEFFDIDMKGGNCNKRVVVVRPEEAFEPRWQIVDDADWSPVYSTLVELACFIVDVPKAFLHQIINIIVKGE